MEFFNAERRNAPLYWAFIFVCIYFIFESFIFLRIVPRLGYLVLVFGFLFSVSMNMNFWKKVIRCRLMLLGAALTFVTLALVFLLNHGPGGGNGLYLYCRAVPFFLFGVVLANARLGPRQGICVLLIAMTIAGLISFIYGIGFQAATGEIFARAAAARGYELEAVLYGADNYARAAVKSYVFILAAAVYFVLHRRLSIFVKICWLLCMLCLAGLTLLSGYSTTMILTGLSIILFLLFMANDPIKMLFMLGLGSIFVFVTFLLVHSLGLAQDSRMLNKAWEVIAIIFSPDRSLFEIPSGRVDLAMISIHSFFENPFFGVGSYVQTGGINVADQVGGHSTFFDLFAQYGILGAIGPVVLYFSGLLSSIKLLTRAPKEFKGLGKGLCVFFIVYFFHSIGNPTFLLAGMDWIVFFAIGFANALALGPNWDYLFFHRKEMLLKSQHKSQRS